MDYPALPDFYNDPMFGQTQRDLYGHGTNILAGNLPDFYKILGENNSPEFQDVLRMSSRDISQNALETAAKTGTRGGAVASGVARATGDMTSRLRYNDLLSTIMNKKFLLGTGLDTLSGVRGGALNFMGQKNQFNLGEANILSNQTSELMRLEAAKKASEDDMWAQIIAGGLSLVGTVGGAMVGGPAGAAAGGTLGANAGKALNKSGLSNGMDFEYMMRDY